MQTSLTHPHRSQSGQFLSFPRMPLTSPALESRRERETTAVVNPVMLGKEMKMNTGCGPTARAVCEITKEVKRSLIRRLENLLICPFTFFPLFSFFQGFAF